MKLKLTLLFILIFFFRFLVAQPVGPQTFYLTEDNRTVNINCIFKSTSGFIYIGTNNGLFKFDGENFNKIFFKNKDFRDTVTAITEDNSKTIWTGFNSGRLAKIENGILTYINPEEGNPSAKISSITVDNNNNLWYAAYGEGLYYTYNNHHYLLNEINGFIDLNISSICKTTNNEILAATDQGIAICSVGAKKVRLITTAHGMPDYMVTHISPSSNNRYWIALQDKGFCLYDHTAQKIITIQAATNWPYGQVNSLLEDNNYLWVATQSGGLLQYNIAAGKLLPESKTGFTDVHQVVKDNQGNLWFNSHENILSRSANNTVQILPFYNKEFFEKIHAVLIDHHSNIWANGDKEIIKFSINNGKVSKLSFTIPLLDEKTDITALYQDRFQNIWIGTMGKGVYLMDASNYKIRHLSSEALLNSASILSISGKGDSVFVCSLQGAIMAKLSLGNDGKMNYRFSDFSNITNSTNYIYSIFKDSKNRLWFATDGDGISVQYSNNSVIQYTDELLLNDGHIYSIAEDKNGNIWFSTASSGIYKFDGKTFTNYGLQNGLSDLNISVVKILASGYIAVVNKKGVDLVNPNTGLVSYLNSNVGIGQLNADNLGATTVDNNGYLLATGSNGFVNCDVPMGSNQQPVTLIESIQLFLNNIDTAQKKIFSHEENHFSFNFIGLYLTDPSAVYYQYQLEGLDSSWINTRDQNLVFPKLTPGKYTFKVRSSLNKNFINANEAKYQFEIKQAFYKTWLFRAAVLFFAGIIIFLYIRIREKGFKKIQKLQQEKIQFRFEILRNQVNPHFLFNSFNTLISVIEDNPNLAVEYTEQLSAFFRNIVSYREKDTISLKEELNLLNTYFFLQQKRYGQNLQLCIGIPMDKATQFDIPPLTLQLLLENAIKHNEVSKDNPLVVNININNNTLTVSNLKHKRNIVQPGAGLGLQNIVNRFKLLTNRSVTIHNTISIFEVHLPLISNGKN